MYISFIDIFIYHQNSSKQIACSSTMSNSSKVYPERTFPSQQSLADRECRICLQDHSSPDNALLTPCECKGSVEYIHERCAKLWVISSLQKKTEVGKKQLIQDGYLDCELCKCKIEFLCQSSIECKSQLEIRTTIVEYLCPFVSLLTAEVIGFATLIYAIYQFVTISRLKSLVYRTEQSIFFALIVVMGIFSLIIVMCLVKIFFIKEENRVTTIRNRAKNTISCVLEDFQEEMHGDLREIQNSVVVLPRRKKRSETSQTLQNIRETTVNSSMFFDRSLMINVDP